MVLVPWRKGPFLMELSVGGMERVLFSFGLLETVAGIQIIAIVMATLIPYLLYPFHLPPRVDSGKRFTVRLTDYAKKL